MSAKNLRGPVRARLARAREDGYLNAMCISGAELSRAHGFWCWKMRLPFVWFERKSRGSKFGRVRLELFTTANLLTEEGQRDLAGIAARLRITASETVCSYECAWENVPVARIEELARAVFRAATRLGNYAVRERSRSPELTQMLAAIGEPVLWKKSA
jgi:hypothetical protein